MRFPHNYPGMKEVLLTLRALQQTMVVSQMPDWSDRVVSNGSTLPNGARHGALTESFAIYFSAPDSLVIAAVRCHAVPANVELRVVDVNGRLFRLVGMPRGRRSGKDSRKNGTDGSELHDGTVLR